MCSTTDFSGFSLPGPKDGRGRHYIQVVAAVDYDCVWKEEVDDVDGCNEIQIQGI